MNNKKYVLEIQGLKKYFTNNGLVNKAADDITFNVREGEIVGLIGESGSGKTTVGRSLLRLYDTFNGFVMLNGKVVSGKRLSRKQTKFLRRNIQMIFQDPHAALNGQRTIYSTLKEPLIVNGIISDEMKNIFRDWAEIKENFYYTFQNYYRNLELSNLKSINSLAKDFFKEWTNNFDKYKYDETLNYEDNFNLFYSYLEEKQNVEAQIVNNIYLNTDNLINFYYEKQKDYREGNLDTDESELIKAKANLDKIMKLSTMSKEAYNAQILIKDYQKQLKELKSDFQEMLHTARNTFNNFIDEFHNEKRINFIARLSSYDLELYTYNLKKEYINKELKTQIKQLRAKLKYLDYNQVRELAQELKNYSQDFYNKYLEDIKFTKKIKGLLSDIIKTHFKFNYGKYTRLNSDNLNKQEELINDLQNKIARQQVFAQKKDPLGATASEVQDAQKIYEKANLEHIAAVDEYRKENQVVIDKLAQDIQEQNDLYNALKEQQSYTDAKFKEISNSYFEKLKQQIADFKKQSQPAKAKELAKTLNIYRTKIKSKLSTLKSFAIEIKYLNKYLKGIRVLLGIDNNRLGENKFMSFLNKVTCNLIARIRIQNLLIKTTIYKSLEDVGLLKQFAYRYPHEFSGGQRQRIVIARALITKPKVIVADEPIASLDISIQAQVVNLLKDLCEQKNIGMIFIAHDLSMIEYIANRVQIMHLGKIVESGDTDVVYKKPIHPYTINLFKAIPKISNAHEKFENINFELNYLEQQQYPNVPELYQVEDNHYVYGTQSQIEQWTKPFNLHNISKINVNEIGNGNLQDNDRLHKPFDGRDEIPADIEYTQENFASGDSVEVNIKEVDFD